MILGQTVLSHGLGHGLAPRLSGVLTLLHGASEVTDLVGEAETHENLVRAAALADVLRGQFLVGCAETVQGLADDAARHAAVHLLRWPVETGHGRARDRD